MEIDADKVDDAVLALLFLTLHDKQRAWNGFDWDTFDRLHRKEMISDPIGKTKSVTLTDESLRRSPELFEALFAERAQDAGAHRQGWPQDLRDGRLPIDAHERCRRRGRAVHGRALPVLRQQG
jgi:hypothetical protein